MLLFARHNRSHGPGDLARDKGLPTPRCFVVKENAVAGKKIVCVAIVARHMVGIRHRRSDRNNCINDLPCIVSSAKSHSLFTLTKPLYRVDVTALGSTEFVVG